VSYYTKVIVELTGCTEEEAPLVEGILRCTYGTLDGLTRGAFRLEGKKALREVRADVKTAEEVARSYGLLPTIKGGK
jgi:hypothetical protein